MTDDKMLGKIRSLLNKAEAQGVTPQEAEALSAKAAELMAKYSIDMAMIDATRTKAEREKPGQHTVVFEREAYGNRKLHLLYVIAKASNCQGIRMNGPDRLVLFGFQADIDMVVMLYTSLLVQAQRALAQAEMPSWDNARSFRTSWWAAYVARLNTRLVEVTQRAKQEAAKQPGTDLVLADRTLQVKSAFETAFPNRRATRVSNGRSASGYRQGKAAADRADIGGARIGQRTAGALR